MSKRGAAKFVERMIFVGYLGKAPDGRSAPENNFFSRSIVGVVPAGFASPAEELLGDAVCKAAVPRMKFKYPLIIAT